MEGKNESLPTLLKILFFCNLHDFLNEVFKQTCIYSEKNTKCDQFYIV